MGCFFFMLPRGYNTDDDDVNDMKQQQQNLQRSHSSREQE